MARHKPQVIRIVGMKPEYWDIHSAAWLEMNLNQLAQVFAYLQDAATSSQLFELGDVLQQLRNKG